MAIPIATALLAVALPSAVGAAASRQAPLKRRVALGLVTSAAVPAAVFAYAQAPYEVVTQEHQATWMIDEYAGTIRGVGIGDSASWLETVFGPGVRWRPSKTYPVPWLLSGGSVFDGPSLYPDPPPSLAFLRYPSSVFEIRNGTIRAIKIIDQRASTTKGLGPGDSISLVRRAYPESHCSQDYIGNETPQPYPYCSVELTPSRWLTFFADNLATGTPIVGVWLTVRPIA